MGVTASDWCMCGVAGDCCVDPAFRLVWSKLPLTIAADTCGYLQTSFDVISGSDVRNASSSSSHSVESAEKHKA